MITTEVLQAIQDGKEVKFKGTDGEWTTLNKTSFYDETIKTLINNDWCIKPLPKKKVTMYPVLIRNSPNYRVCMELFETLEQAKIYNSSTIKLLTQFPVEVEIE